MTLFPSLPVIPCEDCYLNPQTSSEARLLHVSKRLYRLYRILDDYGGYTNYESVEFAIIHQPGVHETGCIFVFAVV